ncbi:hypothetical protein [uncultured Lamprocystis sp.]|uniref:hypothetical protein n=1 Tax=uncultured Lamprocystis sp. TaxID=543132 RepID=UPI0025F0465C|nr:hypothetical protein [uncultured Lamprocystis sp.]
MHSKEVTQNELALVAMALQPRGHRANLATAFLQLLNGHNLKIAARLATGYNKTAFVLVLPDREGHALPALVVVSPLVLAAVSQRDLAVDYLPVLVAVSQQAPVVDYRPALAAVFRQVPAADYLPAPVAVFQPVPAVVCQPDLVAALLMVPEIIGAASPSRLAIDEPKGKREKGAEKNARKQEKRKKGSEKRAEPLSR